MIRRPHGRESSRRCGKSRRELRAISAVRRFTTKCDGMCTVLIDLLVHHVPMAVLCERWGLSASCLDDWQRALLLHGLESLRYRQGGGRRPKLTVKQKQR